MNWENIGFSQLPSPCYVIDCDILKERLETLKKNCDYLNLKPLLAMKGFPLAILYKEMAPYLYGISASGLFEAHLGGHMGKEVHIHAPAYRPEEMQEVLTRCDHIVFNSIGQWMQYRDVVATAPRSPSVGLRVNPEYSEIVVSKYDPCRPYSRFGVTKDLLIQQDLSGLDGLHLHVMCDQDAETFARVISHFVEDFEDFLPQLSWINFGGGQRLADTDCQINLLKALLSKLITEFGLDLYIEPCEPLTAVCGYLVSTVLDIVKNERETVILDTSATCHMPDVLEMPYQPDIVLPVSSNVGNYRYIFAGVSCLAGDIIGEYKLKTPLQIGEKVVFSEMGAYTFARENYFNGINYPSIALYDHRQGFHIVKQFGYDQYESMYWFS